MTEQQFVTGACLEKYLQHMDTLRLAVICLVYIGVLSLSKEKKEAQKMIYCIKSYSSFTSLDE